MENTSDILKAAKRELQMRGWCQHAAVAPDGRVCAFGAITTAIYGWPDDCISPSHGAPVELLIRTATGRDPREIGLARWNDEIGRTMQEVVEAFDAAIAIAESQEALASPEALAAVPESSGSSPRA